MNFLDSQFYLLVGLKNFSVDEFVSPWKTPKLKFSKLIFNQEDPRIIEECLQKLIFLTCFRPSHPIIKSNFILNSRQLFNYIISNMWQLSPVHNFTFHQKNYLRKDTPHNVVNAELIISINSYASWILQEVFFNKEMRNGRFVFVSCGKNISPYFLLQKENLTRIRGNKIICCCLN